MSKETAIAITGATGHIGTAAIPMLIGKGYRLRALVYTQQPSFDSMDIATVQGSLFDTDSLNRLVAGCQVVIHCAGRISLNSNRDPSVYETNVNGTKNVFKAAQQAGVKRFIYISSIHAYNQTNGNGLLDEESGYCPKNAPQYDQSKRDAQQFVLQNARNGMEVVVLNPTAVIGPFDHKPSALGQAIMDIYNKKVPVLISGGFDFCDVRDVAAAIVSAVERGRSGEAYLLGGKWHSLGDLQKIILGIKGDKKLLPVLPAWTGYLGLPFAILMAVMKKQEPLYTKESIVAVQHGHKNISSRKAAAELGYSSKPLQDTIGDTISWFKQAGHILS